MSVLVRLPVSAASCAHARGLWAAALWAADLSPEAIAYQLGCSRAYLCHVFARHGLSVAGYLREILFRRAHSALAAAGPRDTVGNIVFRSGFDNPVYFAHVFFQRFGMRPSEVLRREEKPTLARDRPRRNRQRA